jgi:hypothetical protein
MAPLEILFQGRAIRQLEIKEVPDAGCLLNIMVKAEGEHGQVAVKVISEAPWLIAAPSQCSIMNGFPSQVSLRVDSSFWEQPGEYHTRLEFFYGASESGEESVTLDVCARYRVKRDESPSPDALAMKEREPSVEQEFTCRLCGTSLPDRRPYCSVCRKKKAEEKERIACMRNEAEKSPRHMAPAVNALFVSTGRKLTLTIVVSCLILSLLLVLMIISFRPGKKEEVNSGTGALSLVTDPSDAWVIFLDGQYPMMKTPLSLSSLKAGCYKIHLEKDYCSDGNLLREIIVKSGQNNAYAFKLQKLGSINVQSLPAGCGIIIDGRDSGKRTPALIEDLAIGTHEVSIVSGDAAAPERTFATEIRWKETQNLFALLQKAKSGLLVHCDGIFKVFIDGISIGKTPVDIQIVAPGIHNLTVLKDGCLPWKSSLNFTEGEVAELTVFPVPLAHLALESAEGGALYINGEFKGSPPRTFSCAPGQKLEMKAVSTGGQIWRKEVTLLPGEFRKEKIDYPTIVHPVASISDPHQGRRGSMGEGYAPTSGFYDFSLIDKFPPREWKVSQTIIDDIDNDGTHEMILAIANVKKRDSTGGFPIHLYIIKRIAGNYEIIPLRQPSMNGIGTGELYGLSVNRVDDFGYREIEYVCGDRRGRITSQGAFIIHRGEAYNPRWCDRKIQ